jgi:hypothetical protein
MSLDMTPGEQKARAEELKKNKRLQVLEDKIMKSKVFDNPPAAYGQIYIFDDFSISITGSGVASVMYKGFEVEDFTKEEVRVILNKKIKELSKKFFGEIK